MYMHTVRNKIVSSNKKKSYDNNLSEGEKYFNEKDKKEKERIFNEIERRDIKSKL